MYSNVDNVCSFPVSLCTDGYFYPDVVKYKKLCRKAKYKEYKVCTVIGLRFCLIAEAWVSQTETKTHAIKERLCVPNSNMASFFTWFPDFMFSVRSWLVTCTTIECFKF